MIKKMIMMILEIIFNHNLIELIKKKKIIYKIYFNHWINYHE